MIPSEAPVPRISTVRQAYPRRAKCCCHSRMVAAPMEILEVGLIDDDRGHRAGGVREDQVRRELDAVWERDEEVLRLRDRIVTVHDPLHRPDSRPPRVSIRSITRLRTYPRRSRYAGSASCSRLPIALKSRTVRKMATPGKADSHHALRKKAAAIAQHRAPFRRRRLRAHADEAEAGGRHQRGAHVEGGLHDDRRKEVRQDVPTKDAGVVCAERREPLQRTALP